MTRSPAFRRGGATLVEFALLGSLFLLFLFAVLDYCRYLYLLQVATNAARDGARYAVINMNNPAIATTDATKVTDPDTALTIDGSANTSDRPVFTITQFTTYVNGRMAGAQNSIVARKSGATTYPIVQIYPIDSTSLYADTPKFRPKKQPDTTADPPIASGSESWKQARFPEKLAVRITGEYRPIFPGLEIMGKVVPLLPTPMKVNIVAAISTEG